jgi:hypothetical protein
MYTHIHIYAHIHAYINTLYTYIIYIYIYICMHRILLSHKAKGNFVICCKMNVTGHHNIE